MKRTLLAALFAAVSLILLAPLSSVARSGVRTPFEMRIVDPETGEGVYGIAVRSDNGILCHSRVDGVVNWTESSVMNRNTRFTVDGRMKVTIRPTPGGHAEIRLTR